MKVEFVKDEGFVYYCEQDGDLSGEYVSVADYTALQAENERLREALEYIASGNPAKPGHWLTDVEMADAARAALARRGK